MNPPVDRNLSIDMQVAAIISSGYLSEYNSSFAEVYYLESSHNHIGQSHAEVFPPSNQVQTQELIRELVTHDYTLKDYESVEYDQFGQTRYFLNNIVGIQEDNKLIRFWGTKLETTKQKKHERELLQAKRAAEESSKLKSAFLANMSHEIRTPLNGILGFSELLCNVQLTEEKKIKYHTIIQASNQQLLRIINDILDISRLQTGQISIEKTEFPLNDLIDEIESSSRIELEQNKKEIDLVFDKQFDNGGDTIYTDRERLYQVITNLTNNAVKFTKTGSVKVAYQLKNKSILEFSVTDTGIGIPGEYLGSIFDQFRQVEEFASRQYGGTGLGLSISKGLVELLGGYIAVESEEGVGSTFKFTIKAKKR
jgi:signal transduction histidine kinase